MNPAALKTNVGDLPPGGALIVNSDAFTQANLSKAAYAANPLTDGSLKAFTVFEVPISTLNEGSLDGLDMTTKQKDLTKNFFALGLMFWLYERSMEPTLHWIDSKFSARPVIAEANKRALKAGYAYGETTECSTLTIGSGRPSYRRGRIGTSPATKRPPSGSSRRRSSQIDRSSTGRIRSRPHRTSSTTLGLQGLRRQDLPGRGRDRGDRCRHRRQLRGCTRADGQLRPGIALKSEALGLAVMVELPLVVIDVQRAGPSTGMPTKNEQADLLRVMFGRNSDSVADRHAGDAGRMLRLRHRGLATRPEVHDAGRVPV